MARNVIQMSIASAAGLVMTGGFAAIMLFTGALS